MTTNLLVADEGRTEKTICLAVSPSLKAYGISGRARLFEAVQKIKEVNAKRREAAPFGRLNGKSYLDAELKELLGEGYGVYSLMKGVKNADRIQARMPFEMIVK